VRRIEVHYVSTDEDSKMKPTEHCLKDGERKEGGWEYNGGAELVQGTLNACMELSQ
jgi:hypothetical protein